MKSGLVEEKLTNGEKKERKKKEGLRAKRMKLLVLIMEDGFQFLNDFIWVSPVLLRREVSTRRFSVCGTDMLQTNLGVLRGIEESNCRPLFPLTKACSAVSVSLV